MPRTPRKIFVLDTNVILHDSACIGQFQEHDVVVPISVLEELDQFKKGNESVNHHAREFVRNLDLLSGDKLFNGGARIGPGLGHITVQLERAFHADLGGNFASHKADHQILNIAYHLAREQPQRQVVLVSKDVNLRMKAKSVGMLAQDYRTDHVKDVSSLYTGHRLLEDISTETISKFYEEPGELSPEALGLEGTPSPNEYFILRNGRASALATYSAGRGALCRIEKPTAYGITPRNAEQSFALDALLNDEIKLVSLSGKAGTGKTLLALAAALQRRKYYRQIFLARPVVPLSNKDIGFLPGDIDSKLDPYMQPLYDNLGVLKYMENDNRKPRIEKFLDEEKLVVAPLAFIRGRSLVRVYFIVDEAQNLTPHEVKTIITRAGEGTKVVLTGDVFQIDHPYLDSLSNGLSYLIEKMNGQGLYAHVNLTKGERSELADLASDLL